MTLELRLLQHALAVGRFRNFARAAEALHLTQPSLSRSIATLERTLGVPLFDRGGKGVTPTAFGELLLERGADLLNREGELRREIQLLAKVEIGTLDIGAGPFPSESTIGSAVARLSRTHPRLRISVVTADPDEICRKVLDGVLDVAIANASAVKDVERLVLEALPSQRIYLACRPGHPLAGRRDLELATVLQFPLASPLLAGAPAVAAAGHEGAGRTVRETGHFIPAIHVNSLSIARRIAYESDALFPGTASMLAEDVRSGRLVALDFFVPAMRTTPSLITLRDRTLSPATRAFIEILREVEAEAAKVEIADLPVPSVPPAVKRARRVPAGRKPGRRSRG